jgi:L-asparaginase
LSQRPRRVILFSTGGTIASVAQGELGVRASLDADDLVRTIAGTNREITLVPVSYSQIPSVELSITDLYDLSQRVREVVDAGASGAVIAQGTDTLEETAFVLDLLWERKEPLVVTGAMRAASAFGADGPANLVASVRLAASQQSLHYGCLVVLNDEIHAARYVQKTHTSNPAAFRSPLLGPIGWFSEGQPRLALRPLARHHVRLTERPQPIPVALVTTVLGDDGGLLSGLSEAGYRGLVIDAGGGGHVPRRIVPRLARIAESLPVILASRTRTGEILRNTYDFPGSEKELLRQGLISAGWLDPLKARILLMLLLVAGATREDIVRAFAITANPGLSLNYPFAD